MDHYLPICLIFLTHAQIPSSKLLPLTAAPALIFPVSITNNSFSVTHSCFSVSYTWGKEEQ